MNQQSIETLDRLLRHTTEQLFDAHGCPVCPCASGTSRDGSDIAATIGFISGEVRGALAIITATDLARRSYPSGASAPTAVELGDWIGELANQLLGRIKNRLLAYGLELQLSTPIVVAGTSLSYVGVRAGMQRSMEFAHEGLQLKVLFSATKLDDIEISDEACVDAGGLEEGGVELF